jgi:hypothetical protein
MAATCPASATTIAANALARTVFEVKRGSDVELIPAVDRQECFVNVSNSCLFSVGRSASCNLMNTGLLTGYFALLSVAGVS